MKPKDYFELSQMPGPGAEYRRLVVGEQLEQGDLIWGDYSQQYVQTAVVGPTMTADWPYRGLVYWRKKK